MSKDSIKTADAGMIRCNADGSPWTAMRTIKGQATLVAAIRSGSQWTEVPATDVIRMVDKSAPKAVADPVTNRQQETARQLKELTMRYAQGTVR